jgi:hypothetical protein
MSGDESVPPETMIILRALKVRDCCCLGELVSIQLIREALVTYGGVKRLRWDGPHTHGFSVFHDYFVNLCVALKVQVGVHGSSRVDICMG